MKDLFVPDSPNLVRKVPDAAVAVHEGSKLFDVVNALRLLAYRDAVEEA